MASKVLLNKLMRVASPKFEIGEDRTDEVEIEESMNSVAITNNERLATLSSPMSIAYTRIDHVDRLTPDILVHKVSKFFSETQRKKTPTSLFERRRMNKEALFTALSYVRYSCDNILNEENDSSAAQDTPIFAPHNSKVLIPERKT